jgi:hypothetical protein
MAVRPVGTDKDNGNGQQRTNPNDNHMDPERRSLENISDMVPEAAFLEP